MRGGMFGKLISIQMIWARQNATKVGEGRGARPSPEKTASRNVARQRKMHHVDIVAPKGVAIDSERTFFLRLKWSTTMPTLLINGVVETCLCSGDLPRSVRFYQDQLGLRLLESGDRLCVFGVADK